MLKDHKTDIKYIGLMTIPAVLAWGGIWAAAFHYLLDMAEIGAIFGVCHFLVLVLSMGFNDIRLDIKDLQEQIDGNSLAKVEE